MTGSKLPDSARIGCVRLRVAELRGSLDFYERQLGLEADVSDGAAVLRSPGASEPIIELHAVAGTEPRPRNAPGLYHFALLYPDRVSLGRAVLHLVKKRWPFQGFADHGVSEAAYLADPDGNGLELYSDRPRSEWPIVKGEIGIDTRVLDVNALLRAADGMPRTPPPASLCMGHVHLHVADLEGCTAFYHDVIGFDVVTRRFHGAAFLAAGGYHHHLALNSWVATTSRDPDIAGMLDFEVVTGDAAAVSAIAGRAAAIGAVVERRADSLVLADPDGNRLVVR